MIGDVRRHVLAAGAFVLLLHICLIGDHRIHGCGIGIEVQVTVDLLGHEVSNRRAWHRGVIRLADQVRRASYRPQHAGSDGLLAWYLAAIRVTGGGRTNIDVGNRTSLNTWTRLRFPDAGVAKLIEAGFAGSRMCEVVNNRLVWADDFVAYYANTGFDDPSTVRLSICLVR